MTRITPALALALVVTAGTAAAQTAPANPPLEEPSPVVAEAPQGGSAAIAVGAGVGVLIGLGVLMLIISSGG